MNIDAIALEATQRINDLLVQTHNSTAQRTARIQIVVREAIKAALPTPKRGIDT